MGLFSKKKKVGGLEGRKEGVGEKREKIINFVIVMIKYLTKADKRERNIILAHSSGVQSITAG